MHGIADAAMKKLALILAFLSAVKCDDRILVERLLEAKRVVHPGAKTTLVFRQHELPFELEAALSRVLKDSNDPVLLTNRLDVFNVQMKMTKHSILFVDRMFSRTRYEVYDIDRRIVVTVKSVMDTILEQRKAMNELYVICDDFEYPFYHFNRYINKLNKMAHLTSDPLATAAENLAGLPVSKTVEKHYPLSCFVVFLASRLNATVNHMSFGSSYVSHMPMHQMSHLQQAFEPMFLHRSEKEFALVPRINKPFPLIYVLTDPFDVPSWIAILASVLAISVFRACVTKIYTLLNLLQNIELVVGSFTVGTSLYFNRELDRQISGLFLLLTVVLINAYESLIISYLLSPRFYPELDTFDQLDKTCCWDFVLRISTFNIQRREDCPKTPMDAYFGESDPEMVRKVYDYSYCRIVDEWEWKMLNQNPIAAMTSGLYRWSNQIINQKPSMGWALGDQMIVERTARLGAIYFAEAALYKIAESDVEQGYELGSEYVLKATTVDELTIVWIIFGAGLVLAMVVFSVEIVKKYFDNFPAVAQRTFCKDTRKRDGKRVYRKGNRK